MSEYHDDKDNQEGKGNLSQKEIAKRRAAYNEASCSLEKTRKKLGSLDGKIAEHIKEVYPKGNMPLKDFQDITNSFANRPVYKKSLKKKKLAEKEWHDAFEALLPALPQDVRDYASWIHYHPGDARFQPYTEKQRPVIADGIKKKIKELESNKDATENDKLVAYYLKEQLSKLPKGRKEEPEGNQKRRGEYAKNVGELKKKRFQTLKPVGANLSDYLLLATAHRIQKYPKAINTLKWETRPPKETRGKSEREIEKNINKEIRARKEAYYIELNDKIAAYRRIEKGYPPIKEITITSRNLYPSFNDTPEVSKATLLSYKSWLLWNVITSEWGNKGHGEEVFLSYAELAYMEYDPQTVLTPNVIIIPLMLNAKSWFKSCSKSYCDNYGRLTRARLERLKNTEVKFKYQREWKTKKGKLKKSEPIIIHKRLIEDFKKARGGIIVTLNPIMVMYLKEDSIRQIAAGSYMFNGNEVAGTIFSILYRQAVLPNIWNIGNEKNAFPIRFGTLQERLPYPTPQKCSDFMRFHPGQGMDYYFKTVKPTEEGLDWLVEDGWIEKWWYYDKEDGQVISQECFRNDYKWDEMQRVDVMYSLLHRELITPPKRKQKK